MHRIRVSAVSLGVLALSTAAFAQGAAESPFQFLDVLRSLTGMAYLLGSLVIGYLFSVLFTLAIANAGYPPNMARLGCWLGTVLWAVLVAVVLYGPIFHERLPVWMYITLGALVALFGVVMLASRRAA